MTFHLTQRQGQQAQLMASDATHIMGYGGSRCLSGDAVLDGHTRTIAELAAAGESVPVVTSHGWQWAEAPFLKGEAEMLRFRLWNGHEVTVTSDHRFWNGEAWMKASAFAVDDLLAVRRARARPQSRFTPPTDLDDHDIPDDAGYEMNRVAFIDPAPHQPYFTLHVPGCEHYFANGILHHNSGKTFGFCRGIAARAILAPGSRHAIFRFRFNHIKASIIADTWPKMMDLAFPGVDQHSKLDKTDWYYEFPNSSQVWFAGLDDKERVEKVLGQEYATLFFNECSQIPYASRVMAISRLAQNVLKTDGQPLRLKAYYDCVSGDTILDGQTQSIAELAAAGKPIEVLTTHGKRRASAPWMNGIGAMLDIVTETGRKISVTGSHRFWTPRGWTRADAMATGQQILCTGPEPRPLDGEQGAQRSTRTAPGSDESCCKYPHQRDAQSLPPATGDRACPACASDAEERTPAPCPRDAPGSHTGRLDQQEARRSRHIQASHEPLSPRFSGETVRIERQTEPLACEGSPQTPQAGLISPAEEPQPQIGAAPLPWSPPASAPAPGSDADRDLAAIDKQWRRYTARDGKSQGQKGLLSIEPYVDLQPSDTPLMDGFAFEAIASITQSAAVAYYTLEVPVTQHYLAAGFVSHNCNPPGMAHWTYKMFVEKRDPDRRSFLPNPENFAAIMMNPEHNKENLPATYLQELQNLPEAARRRFFLGQFANISDSQLWSMELLDQNRIMDGQIPQLVRVVVAIDPSGARGDEDLRSDECGIVVVGLGVDGRAYLLEDLSGRMGPADWAAVAVAAYDRHKASQIVAETNYGGAMVAATIKAAANSPDRIAGATLAIPVIEVTASRGKVVRAEPIAALYEQGKVSHVGHFEDLEDQLQSFTTNGYIGTRSPDRGDSLVWAITALFPALTRKDEVTAGYRPAPKVNLGHSKAKARMLSRRR